MGSNFEDILKVIGYIAVTVAIGLIGIRIKEAIGGSFDLLVIVLGWGFVIWLWTKN